MNLIQSESTSLLAVPTGKDQDTFPKDSDPLSTTLGQASNDDASDRALASIDGESIARVGEGEGSGSMSMTERIAQSFRGLSIRFVDMVAEHTGSIGYMGSFAIAVNSLTGPAMLELPATFAESGFIPTTCTLIFVCFLSAFCSLHMANCISKVPSNRLVMDDSDNALLYNHDFKREMEFSSVFSFYWGRRPWFYVTHVLFWGCITCLNISSIVDTAQVVDTILGHITGSIALQLSHGGSEWRYWKASQCSNAELEEGICLPFAHVLRDNDGEVLLLTMGTLITTICFLPLALMDLKENAAWQIIAFLVLLVTGLQFIVQFVFGLIESRPLEVDNLSSTGEADELEPVSFFSSDFLWGHSWDNLFGVVLFNYALVIAVPAWLYERDPHVDVPTVVYGSSFLSTFLYIATGSLGRLAMPHVASNMLASLMSGVCGLFMQIGASVFAFFIVGLGIPLFSVLTRLNLIGSSSQEQQPACSRPTANLLAVFLPFGASWFLYDGKSITKLLSWGGILFTSIVAFILPLSLAFYVVRTSSAPGAIAVYGRLCSMSTRADRVCLLVLFVLALLSILWSIVGNLI